MAAWTSTGQSGCGYKQADNGSDRAIGGQVCGPCQCIARQESGLDARCLEGGKLEVGRAWSYGKTRTGSRWIVRPIGHRNLMANRQLMTNKVEELLNPSGLAGLTGRAKRPARASRPTGIQ